MGGARPGRGGGPVCCACRSVTAAGRRCESAPRPPGLVPRRDRFLESPQRARRRGDCVVAPLLGPGRASKSGPGAPSSRTMSKAEAHTFSFMLRCILRLGLGRRLSGHGFGTHAPTRSTGATDLRVSPRLSLMRDQASRAAFLKAGTPAGPARRGSDSDSKSPWRRPTARTPLQ